MVRVQNGEFTSNYLKIMNMYAATAFWIDRQHNTSQVTVWEFQLTKFNKSLGENKLAAACACYVVNGAN